MVPKTYNETPTHQTKIRFCRRYHLSCDYERHKDFERQRLLFYHSLALFFGRIQLIDLDKPQRFFV